MSENDPSNIGNEEGDPFGFLETFSENSEESSEKIDDAEKERREKIKGNREKYESRRKSINDAWEVAWDTFSDIRSEEGFLESDEYKAVRSMGKGAEDMLTQLRAKLYREQAPLIIQDEKKRELWLENIEEIIAEEKGEGERHGFGFTPIDHWDEKCMEELALGCDMSKVCGMIKECHEGGNDHRIGATYNVMRDIIKYADRGDEFADYIGYSSIDFENDSLEEKNRKIQEVAKKIGFDDVEKWHY